MLLLSGSSSLFTIFHIYLRMFSIGNCDLYSSGIWADGNGNKVGFKLSGEEVIHREHSRQEAASHH